MLGLYRYLLTAPRRKREAKKRLRGTLIATGAALLCAACWPQSSDAEVASPTATPQSASPTDTANGSAVAKSAADSLKLNEVIVTARRVRENVERVPIAITTYSQETLNRLGVADLNSLGNYIPGVSVCCSPYNDGEGLTYIRGLQGAPTYFADAPVSSLGYANFFDVSNFQVLKGPQGTLFGQAAAAGAFVVEPNMPSDAFGGYVQLSAGDYGLRRIEGAVNLPTANDRLLIRLAAVTDSRNGYIHDLSNNTDYDNEDYYIIRPSAIWKITDHLQNYILYQYSHAQDNGNSILQLELEDVNFNPSQPALGGLISYLNGGSIAAYQALAAQALAQQEKLGPYAIAGTPVGCANAALGPIPGASSVTSLAPAGKACPGDWYENQLVNDTLTYTFDSHWSLKNIFSYNWSKSFSQPFSALTPLILFTGGDPKNLSPVPGPSTWSEELQIHGSTRNVDLTGGTFNTAQTDNPGLQYTDFDTIESAASTNSSSSTHAIYGQADIHLDEILSGLTATVGGRYSIDHIAESSVDFNPVTNQVIGVAVSSSQPSGHASFHNVSYTGGLQYQFTPGTMFYVTDARGYSAGGFQGTPGTGYYKPEVLNNLEGGLKSRFNIDGVQARINASVYYGWFNDVQVQIWSLYSAPITDVPQVGFLTQNAATAAIRGFDGDFTLVPFDNLEVGATAAYTSDKYISWVGANPTTGAPFNYANTPFIWAPRWKIGGHVAYYLPFPERLGTVSVSADVSYETIVTIAADPIEPTDPSNPTTGLMCTRQRTLANGYPSLVADGGTSYIDCVPPITNLDVGAEWENVLGYQNVTLNLSVTNVTQNTWMTSLATLDGSVGATMNQPPPPRMFSMRLKYTF